MKEPKIEKLQKMQLVGKHITMSLSNNRTAELWGAFMPMRASVLNRANDNYYSVEVYPEGYFEHFNPNTEFDCGLLCFCVFDDRSGDCIEH